MWAKKITVSILFCLVILSGLSFADDTELYVFESTARSGSRPQVLIIFDTSGSMGTNEYTDTFYQRGDVITDSTKLYFSRSSSDVPESSSQRFFINSLNGCATSLEYLKDYGMFTGFLREYSFSGQTGSWEDLPVEGTNIHLIDCFEDIDSKNIKNAKGQPTGFPIDGEGTQASPVPYAVLNASSTQEQINVAIDKSKLTGLGTGQPVTIYTEKYINWYHSTKAKKYYTRMAIAQRVVGDTIVTTPGVDFGIAVFNRNNDGSGSDSNNGGRIINGIKRTDETTKSTLLDIVPDLVAGGNTPLCETLYEAYRYYSGGNVLYGYENRDPKLSPSRDTSIEKDGKYKSPLSLQKCQNKAYVVYMTDGEPTSDTAADGYVKNLPGISSSNRYENSYLAALAGWMNKNDVNSEIEDVQTISTYTIGFSSGANDAEPLLKETAARGGGQYFAARNAMQLQAALQKVFSNILEVNASFTSPSIASNNFDRTQTFDAVYYAMFLPNKGPRWQGNLKKFTVTGNGDIVDKNGDKAIGLDGNIKSSACSIWTDDAICASTSAGGDGNDVGLGGAAQVLRSTSSRKLYGNFGSGLTDFTKTNAENKAGGETALANYIGVEKAQLTKLFDWAKGADVDDDDGDNSVTDKRKDILGDPLHSKPLAINFGTKTSPDIRILMGTNHGFLHMFKDEGTAVNESWAFMPYELLPNLRELRANVPTGVHSVYGLDSPPVAYVKTGSTSIEKAWVFVGMRRGGKSYYALDITAPDSPKFMWKIDAASLGISEMGQSWSEPVITTIPGWPSGNTSPSSAKPVLIFGAGYTPTTKDGSGVGETDTEGRGVFIVDAETGTLVHFFGPSSGGNSTLMPGITDSIPNSVAVLDSNGDRLTDRIYATDTGANIWRIDLPSANPKDSVRPWTAFKFADLGGATVATDRRFFAEPVVAQTSFSNLTEVSVTENGQTKVTKTYQSIPYDAVVIGSGHRPIPTDKWRSDMFFTLQDRNVVTKSFNGTKGNEIPNALVLNDLYNVSSPLPETEVDNIAFGKKRGWYYKFGSIGEKSLAGATIIQGRVFFTSYVPGDNSAENQCLVSGLGRLYGFDLHKGTRAYKSINNKDYLEMGERVPDTPQLVIPPNGASESYMYLIGIGAAGDKMEKIDGDDGCKDGDEKCVGGGLGVNRIYYHIDE
ncbi:MULTISPECIES: pilus assembly protein [Shewanella]|uniref:pilus assembly protein n=1 Tax=Shewanella TaxID=22 RepID=UPI000D33A7B3|nr:MULTISPECIES: PilC/PilY family type IV pilus protein [Shewanella]MCI2962607.1 rRNA (guanine-N1)-methyltransferase [Shewanella sp. N2AIL]